jgi:hypothetical protein
MTPHSTPHSDISSLHTKLRIRLGEALRCDVTVRHETGTTNWHKAAPETNVRFELQPSNMEFGETALGPGPKARVHVFPLHPAPSSPSSATVPPPVAHAWVSWFEAWKKVRNTDFALVSAGWSVFWGFRGQDKIRVLRAEWDPPQPDSPSNYPQPHWHVDARAAPQTMVPSPGAIGAAPALEELAVPGSGPRLSGTIDISRVHLGMGGWDNDSLAPACWQRTFSGDCNDLRIWSLNTLLYLQLELDPARVSVAAGSAAAQTWP